MSWQFCGTFFFDSCFGESCLSFVFHSIYSISAQQFYVKFSLRLVWLAPTKQLMLLWNVVRKQRTMAQMSTHIFSALQRSPTLLLEYVRGWTSTVQCEEKDYSTAAAYLMGSLFQNIWLKCWYACWKANIFIMWPFYSVGQNSSIPSSRRENCMLALFSFLAFSFSISSSDFLRSTTQVASKM